MRKKERLISYRKELLIQLKEATVNVIEAEQVYNRIKDQLSKIRIKYERVDRELAMLQRTILPPTGIGKKVTPTPPQLTIEQVKAIAKKLGIKIAGEEGEE